MKDFRTELCRSASMADNFSRTDDKTHQSWPLTPFLQRSRSTGFISDYFHRDSNSIPQKLPLLKEKLRSWTADSLDSESSRSTSIRSKCSNFVQSIFSDSASERSFRLRNPDPERPKPKFKSKPQSTSSAPKKSRKWLQFFSPALIKTPTMELQDIRLRQRKLNICICTEKGILKRSSSRSCDRGPEILERADSGAMKFQEGYNSVYEKERRRRKKWRICAPLNTIRKVAAF